MGGTSEEKTIPRGLKSGVNEAENIGAKAPIPGTAGEPQTGLGVRVALLALNCYKTYLSSILAGNCRYQPTCSRYAYEAIERFGVARGVWLGLQRLLRCHPLSRKFGYDPVPEKWEEMRVNRSRAAEIHEVRS